MASLQSQGTYFENGLRKEKIIVLYCHPSRQAKPSAKATNFYPGRTTTKVPPETHQHQL